MDVVRTLDDLAGEYLTFAALPRTGGKSVLLGPIGAAMNRLALFGDSAQEPRIIDIPGTGARDSIKGFWVQPDGGVLVIGDRLVQLDSAYRLLHESQDPRLLTGTRVIGLRDGGVVVNRPTGGSAPFVLLTSALTITKEFGVAAADPDSNDYVMTPSHDGGFWTARGSFRYEITLHDKNGAVVRRLEPVRDWFTPWTKTDLPSSDPTRYEPRPRITAIHELEPGKLFILTSRSDLLWEALSDNPAGTATMPSVPEMSNYFDTRFEVIDAVSGEAIAKRRFDAVLGGFTREGLMWHFNEHDGVGRLRLLRPTFGNNKRNS